LDTTFTRHLHDTIARNVAAFARDEIDDADLRQAAVCVAVLPCQTDDRACFLLTRRASKMSRHSGQYALPGGRVDSGESIEAAALRELEEELGIPATAATVVGRLDDGARFIANTPDDRDALESFAAVENVGREGTVSTRSGCNCFEPA